MSSDIKLLLAGTGGASIVVASGPYTFRGNLDYEPLKELLAFCTQQKPDVLLLMGPFVDVEHPLISSAQTDRLFEDIFQESVSHCADNVHAQIKSSYVQMLVL